MSLSSRSVLGVLVLSELAFLALTLLLPAEA